MKLARCELESSWLAAFEPARRPASHASLRARMQSTLFSFFSPNAESKVKKSETATKKKVVRHVVGTPAKPGANANEKKRQAGKRAGPANSPVAKKKRCAAGGCGCRAGMGQRALVCVP